MQSQRKQLVDEARVQPTFRHSNLRTCNSSSHSMRRVPLTIISLVAAITTCRESTRRVDAPASDSLHDTARATTLASDTTKRDEHLSRSEFIFSGQYQYLIDG